jgi:dihydropteroate synthase
MADAGADLIDVGGESTRPGAGRVSVETELARTIPVVRALSRAGLTVGIDTTRATVARAALDAGAALVNDVSGGLADPEMAPVVAAARVPFVAMHWRGPSDTMRRHAVYENVVAEVAAELRVRLHALSDAGIAPEQIILDPGLGFAKTGRHDWQLLGHLDELFELGRPVLVGPSRKSFLAATLVGRDGAVPPPTARDVATVAVCALAAAAGAFCVRVHDVSGGLDAVRVAAEWSTPPSARRTTRSAPRTP